MTPTPDPKTVRKIAQTAGRLIVESLVSDHIVHKAMAQHFIGHDNVYAWSETYDRVLGELAAVLKPLTQPDEQPQHDDVQAARAWLADLSENIRSYHQSIPGQPGCTCGRSLACGNDVPDYAAISTLEAALDAWRPAEEDEQPQDDGDVRAVRRLLMLVEADTEFSFRPAAMALRHRFADRIAALEARDAKTTAEHAPATWAALYDIEIVDPDGWRGSEAPPWEQPITLAEFYERARRCTVRNLASVDWQQIARDAKGGE